MQIMDQDRIILTEGSSSAVQVIRDVVESGMQEEPFFVMDVGEVVTKYHRWKELMPRVEPFYAVKCNDHKLLVSTLAALGTGFDCASKAEIELVTSLGVNPERIIFANPTKMAAHIRYSSAVGVDYSTFDSETELDKMKLHMPHAQLVIRIRCDAKTATCSLGDKFGCDPITEAPHLLKYAAAIGLEIVGVSFHVGSGSFETEIFAHGIALCRKIFDVGISVGHTGMHLLDLGGGFPGETGTDIFETSQVINSALEKYFPSRDVRVIAEPGRYFAVAAYTLAACVHSKREVIRKNPDEETHTMYFISDGVYGTFNSVVTVKEVVTPELAYPTAEARLPCSIWGPTLDSLDCLVPDTRMPPLRIGDWMFFRDRGAYSLSVACTFNGFPVPKVLPFVDSKLWSMLKSINPLMSVQLTSKKRPDSEVKTNKMSAITASL